MRPLLLSLLALPVDLADAVRIGITGHRTPPRHTLQRRATLTGLTGLNDSSDITYTTNITLGGNEFSVIIDTGRCVHRSLIADVRAVLTRQSCLARTYTLQAQYQEQKIPGRMLAYNML